MPTGRGAWALQLRTVFAAVVLSFAAVTAFTHWRLAGIDAASLQIADNASPSIERLAAARGEMRRLQVLLHAYLDRRAAGEPADTAAIDDARRSMDEKIDQYVGLPVFPGEQRLWGAIVLGRDQLTDATARCLSEVDRGRFAEAEAIATSDVSHAADALGLAFMRDEEFNASRSHDLAMRVRHLRVQATWLAGALDAACAAIAIAGATALQRASRAHAELTERHRRLLEARASELEQFAGRIAHDVLSPLNGVGLALELAGRPGQDEHERTRHVARGKKALQRVQLLVHDLLEFARAGARPDPSASCDVADSLADLVDALASDAAAVGAELHATLDVESRAACNPGVLTSIVENLGRNAIKYLGDAPVRRIDIRAVERPDRIRLEVEDTGPGLPPGLEGHVFEPYVRAARGTQGGIGLGLATVKRLAEAHGGAVGVASDPGRGCTFWVHLPKAPRDSAPRAAAAAPSVA